MIKEMSTKALPNFDWGQEWIKSNGELSAIVVVHEPFDEPFHLHKTFPKPNIMLPNVTNCESERTVSAIIQQRLSELLQIDPNRLCVLTSHHAFIFNLVHDLDFRPDMFYIYSKNKGYQRLTDCAPRALKKEHNYAKMYITGAFDNEDIIEHIDYDYN